ncbi:MAG: hypothetical protein CMI01_08430 [Oceanospirillaceae bacterium]|nr:hypothetical protein [Oceanospirillaceae bacterium]
MRKLATWFSILVLLPAILAAGAYGFYWYQVKSYADRFVEQAMPVAEVTYGAIYAHPLGEVGVDGVNIRLHTDGTTIPIDSIRIKSQDPLFFLDPQGRIESGDWPPYLSLMINGLEVGLNSGLIKSMEAQAAEMASLSADAVSPNALACGDVQNLDTQALREMGYNRVKMDLMSSLQVNPAERLVRVMANADLDAIGRSNMDIELSVASSNLAPSQMLAANPRLQRIELEYQDGGYNIRRNRFCSEKAGVEVDAYLAEHRRLLEQMLLSQGVDLPEPVWAMYTGVNQPRGRINVVIDPPGGLGPEVMAGMSAPTELIERLNMRVRVNDQPVAIDTIDWAGIMVPPQLPDRMPEPSLKNPQLVEQAPEAATTAPDASSSEGAASAGVAAETGDDSVESEEDDLLRGMPKRDPEPEPKRFQVTAKNQLASWEGAQVRVYTELGNALSGRMLDVKGGEIRIEQRLQRGIVIYPLNLEQIKTVEVYR